MNESAQRVADRLLAAVAITGATDDRRASDLRWGPWLMLAAQGIVGLEVIVTAIQKNFLASHVFAITAWVLASAGVYASTRPARGLTESLLMRWTRFATRLCALLAVLIPVFLIVAMNLRDSVFSDGAARVWLNLLSLTMFWVTTLGTTLFYMYASRVALACRAPAMAFSSAMVAAILILGMSAAVNELVTAPPSQSFSIPFSSSGRSVMGSGFVRSMSFSRVIVNPALPWTRAIDMTVGVLFQANGWWAILTLINLGLMRGRP